MRKIDKLLQQVKDNLPGGNLHFMGGVCICMDGVYQATAHIWNYKEGPAREMNAFKKEFNSEEEAEQWYKEIEKQYPPKKGKEPNTLYVGFMDDVKE